MPIRAKARSAGKGLERQEQRAVADKAELFLMARVLIVDDEPQVRKPLEAILLRAGHDVHTACSGADAVQMCSTSATYDVILSDVTMPGLGGHELAQRIAIHRPQCRVILMSAAESPVIRLRMLLAVGSFENRSSPPMSS